MLIYHSPAVNCCACSGVSVASPLIGLATVAPFSASQITGGPARVSEQHGERGLYPRASVEGGYRGGRLAYRERTVGTGVGVAAADYGYRGRRLYAYAPGYETGYAAAPRYIYLAPPRYSYAPGYDIGLNSSPYYAPAGNAAYAGPYYDYTPGVSFGIGPVGVGFGPW